MSATGGQPRAPQGDIALRQFDVICVDGSHALGDAMCDLLLADRLLRPGGWLLADDVDNRDYPGVAEAWTRLPERYEWKEGPPTWGVARKARGEPMAD